MVGIRRVLSWETIVGEITDEEAFWNRRRFLKAIGASSVGLGLVGCGAEDPAEGRTPVQPPSTAGTVDQPRPAAVTVAGALERSERNRRLSRAGRPITDEEVALHYNNFYEFSTDKRMVSRIAEGFDLDPYRLRIDGLVERPGDYHLDDLLALGVEERIYLFRCVEPWAMTVPWSGVPLAAVLDLARVRNEARYVRFVSFLDKEKAPGQRNDHFDWPYQEALRLDEARHGLTLLTCGAYGKPLAPQSGPPLRVIVPWKYGFKGPKSIVRIELTAEKPPTFWNSYAPGEYGWSSNVDPSVPHPRWSQESERLIGSGERVATLPYNGYGELVAHLYRGGEG